uniref:Protein E7 n=1 Tax=Human papillomavirus TaxID=10566 RepID=A0A385PLA9_9PAPI|nr:MAG: E7 protein [Human papillomavirus]
MRGERITIPDIELKELVLPANILTNESLSPDVEAEEEEREPYKVDSYCYTCTAGVRICVLATKDSIRTLQVLLQGELSLLCPGCSRAFCRNGRH